MAYSPPLLVLTVRTAPVPVLVAITSAPEMTAPAWSLTTPEIVPVNFCAANGSDTHRKQASTNHINLRILSLRIDLSTVTTRFSCFGVTISEHPTSGPILRSNTRQLSRRKIDYVHLRNHCRAPRRVRRSDDATNLKNHRDIRISRYDFAPYYVISVNLDWEEEVLSRVRWRAGVTNLGNRHDLYFATRCSGISPGISRVARSPYDFCWLGN